MSNRYPNDFIIKSAATAASQAASQGVIASNTATSASNTADKATTIASQAKVVASQAASQADIDAKVASQANANAASAARLGDKTKAEQFVNEAKAASQKVADETIKASSAASQASNAALVASEAAKIAKQANQAAQVAMSNAKKAASEAQSRADENWQNENSNSEIANIHNEAINDAEKGTERNISDMPVGYQQMYQQAYNQYIQSHLRTVPVNYIQNYDVRLWDIDNQGNMEPAELVKSGRNIKISNEVKSVNGIEYVKVYGDFDGQWVQKQYIEPGSYQKVNYVPGYGIKTWHFDNGQATIDDDYIEDGDYIKVVGDKKVVNGVEYTQIINQDENVWVESKYLTQPKENIINYVPGYGVQNWKINADGKMNAIGDSYTESGTSISVFDSKEDDGISYSRIGSPDNNIWVQTQYLK
ncbi:hypothetical protein FC86_GL000012 [Holzapfeliella floricola DSM 23037 = JCM 16512]|uniref:Uncharacterized protein n=1 Tax=Holzapfeliella floricola DSM 23037 = JCM 16512 TaxID=1423744 RepID=A0A0R2DWN2_9LACO|nr:hypothetical protein FC86_GL000012 [Holzapfeliella floricola DSM 23037 = JCM 16512]